jgi:hypothetical protein
MIKTAICFSGFIRSYEKYFNGLQNLLTNSESDTFFYGYKHQNDTEEYINQFVNCFKFKKYNIKNPSFDFLKEISNLPSHPLDLKTKNTLSMFYNIRECFKLIDEYQSYDLIIRARTDIVIKKPIPEEDVNLIIKNKSVMIPSEWCYKCVDSRAVSDTFAVGHPEPMKIYCNTIDNIKDFLNIHPETLLGSHLQNHNVDVILKDGWIYDIENAAIRKTKHELISV